MKTLLVLFALFSVAAASLLSSTTFRPSFESPVSSHLKKLHEVKRGYEWVKSQRVSSLDSVMNPSLSQKRQDLPKACTDEIWALVSIVNSTSCDQLEYVFENLGSFSEAEAMNALQAQCGSQGCITQLSTQLLRIQDKCPPEIFDDEDDVKLAVAIFQIPCIKEGNTYCFAKFAALVALSNDTNDDDLPTKEQLDSLCHPCIRRVISYLFQFAPEGEELDFSFLDLVCLQDNNQYCILSIAQKFEDIENNYGTEGPDGPDPEAIKAYLSLLCDDRCFSRFIAIAKAFDDKDEYDDGEADFFTNFNGLCVKYQGEFCLARVFEAAPSAPDTDALCGDYSSCPTACKNGLANFVDKVDCCLPLFFELLKASNDTTEEELNAITTFVEDKCKIDIPDFCPPPAIIRVTFTIRNLNPDYVAQHRQEVERLIKLDISANTGISIDQIEIVSINPLGNNVVVEVILRPDNFANEIASDFENDGSNFHFSSLSTLPASAKNNPVEPFGVEGVETSVEQTDSGVSTLTVSLFLVVVAFFFFF